MSSTSSSSDDLFNPHHLYQMYASSSSSGGMLFDHNDSSDMNESDTSCTVSSRERMPGSFKTTYTNDDCKNSLFYKQYVLPVVQDDVDDENSIHDLK